MKPNKARKVPSTALGCAMVVDYATVRGSPKRSMSLGGPRMAAPIGGTQPLGFVLALLVEQKKTRNGVFAIN